MSLEAVLEGLKDSLAAALPTRVVQRSLPPDAVDLPREQLLAGVVCLVNEGGGDFASYYGREGELGEMDLSVACFLQVAEDTEPVAIENAELAVLEELLAWCKGGPFDPAEDLTPKDWAQSKQLQHPYGWLILKLKARF